MFRCMGWCEAADLVMRAMERTIEAKTVTYDFARLMRGAKILSCSEFANAVANNM